MNSEIAKQFLAKLIGIWRWQVDEATHKFNEHAPPSVKQVASQAKVVIHEVRHKAERVVSEAQSGGPRAVATYVATESKQFVLIGSVKLWAGLNHYQPFHAVAKMAVPTVAHWSEKYNHVIKGIAGKGYSIFGYVPLIPIDEIAKAFKQGEAKVKKGDEASSSDSDWVLALVFFTKYMHMTSITLWVWKHVIVWYGAYGYVW